MVADDALEAVDKSCAGAGIDAVAEPDDLDIGRIRQRAFDQRQRLAAVDAVRLRFELHDLNAGGAGDLQGNVARGFGQGQEGDAAIIGLGPRHQLVGGAQPRVPGCRGGPAVIEQDQQRRTAARCCERRIPQGTGGGDNAKGGKRQPQ